MLEKRVVNVTIGSRFREKLAELIATSRLHKPIPELIWGRWDDEEKESYFLGFHERENLPANDPIRIIEADGIELLIMDDQICNDLEGKTLDIVDGKLSIY